MQLTFSPTKNYSLWSSISLWVFTGIGVFFAFILLWNGVLDWPHPSSYKNMGMGVALLVFFGWFRWQFVGQSTVTLDAGGVRQRQPVVDAKVNWTEIKSVSIRESTRMVHGAGAMVRVHRQIAEVITKKGRRVVFVLSTLGQHEQEQLERWLEQAAKDNQVPAELLILLKNNHR